MRKPRAHRLRSRTLKQQVLFIAEGMQVTVQTEPVRPRHTLMLLCSNRKFVAAYPELNNAAQTG